MRVLRSQPWIVIAIVGLVVVGGMETVAGTGWAGFGAAVAGALIGVVGLPMALQIGLLLGAAIFGLRVRHIVLGAMRRVASWPVGRVTITIRWLPVTLRSEIGPWRGPVILRCWLAGLTSAVVGVGVTGAGWLLLASPFGRGFVLASTPLMLFRLWPRRTPMATSTGWLLFGLPRLPGPARAEFCAGPVAARAYEALQSGDLATAQKHVDDLATRHPDLSTTVSSRATMHTVHGEYAQGFLLLLGHISADKIEPRELCYLLAGLASLGLLAAESRQLPADEVLPVATKALDDAITLGYSTFQLSGTRGLLALLQGDADDAVRLASLGAEHNTSAVSRADDLVTVARAHMVRHDNAAAREALRQAEGLAAWWPRVRETRDRLLAADH